MKKMFPLIILLAHSALASAQIDFTGGQNNTTSNGRFFKADSAIRANEFGEVHSLIIVKNGKLIFEQYYNGWNRDSVHQLQSATKSVVSALLGCSIQQGFVKNVNEEITVYYPKDYFDSPLKREIKIEDLLTQQHGLKWKEAPWDDPGNKWRKVLETEGDWYKTILQTAMDTAPGTFFNYSNAAPVLTAGLIQRASKMQIDKFAKKYLLGPLKITQFRFWNGNGGPQNNGMALLSLTSRGMAKFGQLYLQGGKWNNRQVIPENFIRASVAGKVKNVGANGFYSGYDYGYFWWSNPVSKKKTTGQPAAVFIARGHGGQNIIVWPEKQMVVVITAWNMQQPNKPLQIFDEYILNY
jgi:CubicO group peptidase (beta-lactamase class C family)